MCPPSAHPCSFVVPRATSRVSEQFGFTLIELVVAMVLALIALSVAAKYAIEIVGQSQRTVNHARSSGALNRTFEVFGDDVRKLRSQKRADGADSDALFLDFKKAGSSTLTPLNEYNLDIIKATASEFWFHANVVSSGGDPTQECVKYTAYTSGQVIRQVFTSCSGGTQIGSTTVLLRSAPSGTSGLGDLSQVFEYTRFDQDCSSFPPPPATLAGFPAYDPWTLNRINSVKITARSFRLNGRRVSKTVGVSKFSIRNRINELYLSALNPNRDPASPTWKLACS